MDEAASATRASSVPNGPSSGSAYALTSEPGLAEVAREGLGEDDQVGAGRDRLGEAGAVGGGVEPARPLVDAHAQLVESMPPECRGRAG